MSRATESPEHAAVAELLAAYVDGALDDARASRVEAHLLGCELCQREVMLQTALRAHLVPEAVQPSAALRERIRLATYGAPEEKKPAAAGPGGLPAGAMSAGFRTRGARSIWRAVAPWAGWAVAAALAALLLVQQRSQPETQPPDRAAFSEQPQSTDSARVPMVRDALADYRRLARSELPLDGGGLARVEAQLPFPVTPLASPGAQLIGAWTAEILDQPAAVLAYRWNDRVVLQYVVSEALFFAPAEVRQAVADQGRYAVSVGAQGVVAWPGARNGSILIGDLPPAELAELRS